MSRVKTLMVFALMATLALCSSLLTAGLADGGANHRIRNLNFGVSGGNVLDRSKPVLVDGTVYSENRLVHITPPVDTKADAVVDAHSDPARHPWQGF